MSVKMSLSQRNLLEKERRAALQLAEKEKEDALLAEEALAEAESPTLMQRKKSPCAKCGQGCVVRMCPRWEKWFRGRWQTVREIYGKGEEPMITEEPKE